MLFVIFTDNSVIYEKVLEGNNVTLDPGIKTLLKGCTVKWTQGPDCNGTLIAQWEDAEIFINETLKDVLQLDNKTGALTMNRMTMSLEGFYCLMMLCGHEPHILRKYHIIVYEHVPTPHLSSAPANVTQSDGICSVNCSVRNAPEVLLSWYQGEKNIDEISDSDISVNLTLPLQIQSQPETIYTCRASNPVSDATASLNSTQWCPPHHSGHKSMLWILVGVVPAVTVLVILIIYLYKRRNRQGAQGACNMFTLHQMTSPQNDSVSEGSDERLLANPTQQPGQTQ
uniref:Uncharacterized LOC110967818 n=1 Tax=Acanthochromis polyacanthus TaxID=80966 RepID=A0A3Q1FJB7_9TELE